MIIKWKPKRATMETAGWDGWYVSRWLGHDEHVYFPDSPEEATKEWARAKAKELNNG